MLAQLTPASPERQPNPDPRTIPDLLRAELERLQAVLDDLTARLDDQASPPAGQLLGIAVAVRTATQELGRPARSTGEGQR